MSESFRCAMGGVAVKELLMRSCGFTLDIAPHVCDTPAVLLHIDKRRLFGRSQVKRSLR